jgi:hypothetical protein
MSSGELRCWKHMLDQCMDPYSSRWPRYGGRGIGVCDAWLEYPTFLRDMGPRPEGHVLARKDLDGDYTPANCHWLPCREARRLVKLKMRLTYHGETLPIAEWAERTGLPATRIRSRLSALRWPVGQALGLEPRSV